MQTMEDRFVDLESRLTYQERTIEELNEVVIRQQEQIDLLTEKLEAVVNHLREAASPVNGPAEEEPPPPHY
jgi:SlyX protein